MKRLIKNLFTNSVYRKARSIRAVVLMISVFTSMGFISNAQVKNIVLVHGAWADGSGWEGVYKILKAKGYMVSIVSTSNMSLTEDVAMTKAVLSRQKGPVILVGHSYGGAVISQAGDTSSVVGLVYVSAFAPDAGESLLDIIQSVPANPESGIMPPKDGLIWYDIAKFHRDFCPDLPAEKASFMADSQVPVGLPAFATKLTTAAWKTKPSWFVVSKDDRMIPPDAERTMAKRAKSKITEIKASHVAFISHPREVADVIEAAASGSVPK